MLIAIIIWAYREFIHDLPKKTKQKYILTDDTITESGHTLYRIKACRSFGHIKAGTLGGYIESEYNLDHSGNCWIGDNAKVYGHAKIYENAEVYEEAQVYDYGWVSGDARVHGEAMIFGNTYVFEHGDISGDACVYGKVHVRGRPKLNSGIWNQLIQIDEQYYLISNTLGKILMEMG